ncbi:MULTISPECIES: LLM class flavin-dependent oxidoreductase [Streptomyces]|uniref:LLM class flavin-dependent oxidoreductase n=3 Tax=Streptomyces cinereoruber TaxID=67260 RepID=A0ABX6BBH2_9ACTN|nr:MULTISPECIES: LLM class flavin-dependent oxidoreductase [Streptomyces]AVH98579.1 LLM class flavin-dependent oxidoreductase [Streptomyces sp. WAC00288]KYG52521.1 alkanal monooxygenase [Streptomyces sp. WAC04657]MBB4160781.1 luciferase family oxidoreductase group 1 [Streptomyces cinereoruber]MBY8820606.1 LLM class flavin-dependent oxidoreductase [Streptomyces cinereoruber]NIH62700.1 luciferase family oxidoreductase group 1 [Streptomyces cinereoruber]
MTTELGFRLSVLDTAPVWQGSTATVSLRNTIRLARAVDRLGYHRFWLAEHHNMPALSTSSPAILAGQIAAATTRLRVGAGGVMLPNHPPLVVAEQFGTLAALHPGRVDLGVGRAPGTDPLTARALRRQTGPLGGNDFPAQIQELMRYFAPPAGTAHVLEPGHGTVSAVPAAEHSVPVWLLGSSGYSAQLAAALGLPFAYAHHFSPHGTTAALDAYRAEFRPSEYLAEPYTIVSVFCGVAEDDERAARLSDPLRVITARSLRGQNPYFPSVDEAARFSYTAEERAVVDQMYAPQIFGGPETARRRVTEFAKATGADELMMLSVIQDHDERVRSYELLAEVTGLGSPADAPSDAA